MATKTRNPTSDVSFTGTWTGSAGSRFQAVDDHPDSGNPIADGLTHGTTAGEGLFGFAAFDVPAGSTNISVQVLYYDFKNGSQGCNLRARIRCNDTTGRDAPGGTHNPGNGNSNIALRTDDYATTNPKSGAAWTVDDVNGVGTNGLTAFGVVSTDANPSITISSIIVQVTYTPPTSSGSAGLSIAAVTLGAAATHDPPVFEASAALATAPIAIAASASFDGGGGGSSFFYWIDPDEIDLSCPINWEDPLARGLVGLWAGLPASGWWGGNTLRDLVGHSGRKGNHGTLTNGPTWSPGRNGTQLLNFVSGSSQYVDIAAAPEFDVPQFSVLAFFLPTQTDDEGIFERTTLGTVNTGSLLFCETNVLKFRVCRSDGGGSGFDTSTAGTVATGTWHFGAGTFDGSTISCYLDHDAPATATLGGTLRTGVGISRLGSLVGLYGFNGAIAFVGYLDRCLTAGEVSAWRSQFLRGLPDVLRRVRPWGFGVTVEGGDTFTATAALTLAPVTLAASAEFDPPVFTAAAALTLAPVAIAATADADDPVFAATAALALAPVTLTASGTVTEPSFDGSASLTLAPVTIAASAEFDPPVFTAAANLTLAPVTIAATADADDPVFSAAAALALAPVTLTATGTVSEPSFDAAGALTLAPITIAASATFEVPVFTAAAALTLAPVAIAATADADDPVFAATAALTLAAVTFAGEASMVRTGSATLTLAAVQFAGTATFAPSMAEPPSVHLSGRPTRTVVLSGRVTRSLSLTGRVTTIVNLTGRSPR